MTTAVVVTTIVSHDSTETRVVDQLFEQLRANDRDLRTALANLGLEAKVTSSIVNIDPAKLGGVNTGEAASNGGPPTTAGSAEMSEVEFMDYLLEQIQNGDAPSYARLSSAALADMADEAIGEHLAQHPFLY